MALNKSKKNKWLWILIIVILIGAAAYAIYYIFFRYPYTDENGITYFADGSYTDGDHTYYPDGTSHPNGLNFTTTINQAINNTGPTAIN